MARRLDRPPRPQQGGGLGQDYVAFLRAINVAGHASVRMEVVREAFAAAGGRQVRTYIQSGNVIFQSSERDAPTNLRRVRDRLRKLLGDEPAILLRTVRELEELFQRAPFRGLEAEPEVKLYVAFLFERPRGEPVLPLVSAKEALEAVAMSDQEVFVVSRRKANGFFGFPNNFVEKELGVPATTRNWSTIRKMVALVKKEVDG